jgi:hypothetical protein
MQDTKAMQQYKEEIDHVHGDVSCPRTKEAKSKFPFYCAPAVPKIAPE